MEILLLPLLACALLMLPFAALLRNKKSPKSAKRAFITNLCSFAGVMVMALIFNVGGFFDASAAEEVAETVSNAAGLGYLGAALATGLGSIGCGIAVGGAAPAAIGAVAEDPKSFSKALIFVALGEGVALYGFLISFMILNKI